MDFLDPITRANIAVPIETKYNMQKLRCGNCGGHKHTLWQLELKDAIIAKCVQCKNKSEIALTNEIPKLSINWVNGSDGILTVYGKRK